MGHFQKDKILFETENAFTVLVNGCEEVREDIFFRQKNDKWSVAQNVQHLIQSTQNSMLPFQLPSLVLKLKFGKSKRPSKNYEELKTAYEDLLSKGAKASKRYIPDSIIDFSRDGLLKNWKEVAKSYLLQLEKYDEKKLDMLVVPHPILGKITLRELCYFTIIHTLHHLNNIKKIKEATQD